MQIPVTLLLGKHGSGKTTLLNPLLKSGQWADTLVIWQEPGATALQHPLAAHAPADIQRAAACACCVRAQDLASTLANATWRFSRNGRRLFKRVVIEAAGDACAADLADMIRQHPRLSITYCLADTLATLSAVTGLADLATTQIGTTLIDADQIIVTGTARIDATQLAALQAALQRLNPAASLWKTLESGAEPTALAVADEGGAMHTESGLAPRACKQKLKESGHA